MSWCANFEFRGSADALDLDDSGSLDTEEVEQLLVKLKQPASPAELVEIMAKLDADGNGEVDLSEFMAWWKCVGREKRVQLTELNGALATGHPKPIYQRGCVV